MHPEGHGRVAILLANPELPYKTYDEFIRDAVYHRWQWLAENEDDPEIEREAKLLRSVAVFQNAQRVVAGELKLLEEVRNTTSGEGSFHISREELAAAVDSVTTPSIKASLQSILDRFGG